MRWGVGREVQEGTDICILVADSHCCVAEASTILQSNYPPNKKKFLKYFKKSCLLESTLKVQFIHPSAQMGKLRGFYATSSKPELRKMQEDSDFRKWPGITSLVCYKMLIILSNLNENALKYRPAGGWEKAILVPHPDLSFSKAGTTLSLSWSSANKMSQPRFCDTPSGDTGDTSLFSVCKKETGGTVQIQ